MNEKAFRLDFFIAIGALAMSIITTIALVYQTRVIHDQYAVGLWPYLTVDTTFGFPNMDGIEVKVLNDGFGPALIHSAQLSVEGRPVHGWVDYGRTLGKDPLAKRVRHGQQTSSSASSFDGSSIVRPGESVSLLRIVLPVSIPEQLFRNHPIALDICYCSLNDSCWLLHATPGQSSGNRPVPVKDCPGTASISANPG